MKEKFTKSYENYLINKKYTSAATFVFFLLLTIALFQCLTAGTSSRYGCVTNLDAYCFPIEVVLIILNALVYLFGCAHKRLLDTRASFGGSLEENQFVSFSEGGSLLRADLPFALEVAFVSNQDH